MYKRQLPATMAEGVEYIPAPYALDAERAGPKAYVEPVFLSLIHI